MIRQPVGSGSTILRAVNPAAVCGSITTPFSWRNSAMVPDVAGARGGTGVSAGVDTAAGAAAAVAGDVAVSAACAAAWGVTVTVCVAVTVAVATAGVGSTG